MPKFLGYSALKDVPSNVSHKLLVIDLQLILKVMGSTPLLLRLESSIQVMLQVSF